MPRSVVITSYGVVSALGCSPAQITSRLKSGDVAFVRSKFDRNILTCPIRDGFDLKKITGRWKNSRYLNRGAQLSTAAAMSAVQQANLTEDMLAEAGLFVGAAPNLDIGAEFPEIQNSRLPTDSLAALWILRFLPNTAAAAISQLAGIHGENATISTACSASTQAIGEAFRRIRDGYLDLAFAGGGDSRLSPGGLLAYQKAQILWTASKEKTTPYTPFGTHLKGFIPGEGGAFFLLEELTHARSRGARILAQVCGYGLSMDASNMTAPRSDGRWAQRAVRSALKDAGLCPAHIEVVSTHGTGTALNDYMEAALISQIYGQHKPWVIALKSWIGHLASACGAVELAIALTCLANNLLPEIRNLKEPCCPDINFVQNLQNRCTATLLLENFGFGGQNSALVIKKWNVSPSIQT